MVITNNHASTDLEATVFSKGETQSITNNLIAPQKCWGSVMSPNGPDLVQAFQRKGWVKSDFKVPQPPPTSLPLRLKLIY